MPEAQGPELTQPQPDGLSDRRLTELGGGLRGGYLPRIPALHLQHQQKRGQERELQRTRQPGVLLTTILSWVYSISPSF